ncbi:P-loop containing nucleoside triphosphate hydrolase protein [Collybia nuda]|uniref:P-loop containing nucleoside triphosphate hydrolase protein n=1 Tax=Collybia nuda TaxID=64659 RepID=A0A9P6CIY3_9AGAR|nr:P-loop containing nucleoside triphosphate hydrolase protein [Collybia nuda]
MSLPFEPPPPYDSSRDGKTFNKDETINIAVFGSTGSGKSTLINLLTGANFGVSSELQSCTQNVSITEKVNLDGRLYRFIDTPGFDDTDRSEVEILKIIAEFLGTHYVQGASIHGILYLHRISDIRMGNASRRSFRLFRKLCGEASLRNMVIVTTMWNRISEVEGERRESELRQDDKFFKPIIDEGAIMIRHDNTFPSALQLVKFISEHPKYPVPLAIQIELITQGKQIVETNAGRELEYELQGLSQKHKKELEDMLEEHKRLVADRDRRERDEMAEELAQLRSDLTRVTNELNNLQVKVEEDFDAERMWKRMSREARVITMFMRSQGGGAQQSPENLRFWAALGDTTRAAKKLSSLFDRHPMPSELQDNLFNYSKNSFNIPGRINKELGQWVRTQANDVKSMEKVMEKVVHNASKPKKRGILALWFG